MTAISSTHSPSTAFTAWQQRVEGKIGDRLDALTTMQQSLQANTSLSDADRQKLQSQISSDITGLQALQTKVAGDTTKSALQADTQSMIVDYRVYAVATPQVHLAEQMANQAQRIASLQARINSELHASNPDASANLADAQTQLNAAQSALQGKSDALLAVTPQDYSATLFNQYRGAVNSATAYLNATRTDLGL
jgi:Flp pilus assembly CpaF family ATPase